VIADIRDAEKLKDLILDFEPDFIFHLAAQPLVKQSFENPAETYAVNVQGTVNVLDALRFLKKKCVAVMVTTDKVYANQENGHYYNENDKLGGFDPYSASKACAELVIDSYRNSFFNKNAFEVHNKSISVGRAGNVIGGGDWSKDRIIPDVIRALKNNEAVKVRNPNSVRPWQHVLEPVFGYIKLAACQEADPVKFATSFNFGPERNDNLPVYRLVEMAAESWGSGVYKNVEAGTKFHEANLLHLDITKAKEMLNWKPSLNSSVAIKDTIEWYKALFNEKSDIKEFTDKQIKNYLKTIQ
jgi:CDP-glucose 4,6-dehydratase